MELRLTECPWLRVKDVDFGIQALRKRDGKGPRGRVTVLPEVIVAPLMRRFDKIHLIHELHLGKTLKRVYYAYALLTHHPADIWRMPADVRDRLPLDVH